VLCKKVKIVKIFQKMH